MLTLLDPIDLLAVGIERAVKDMVHGDMPCAALARERGHRVSRRGEHADDTCKVDDGDEECEDLAGLVAWACLGAVSRRQAGRWRTRGTA